MYFDNEASIVLGIHVYSWLSAVSVWRRVVGTHQRGRTMKLTLTKTKTKEQGSAVETTFTEKGKQNWQHCEPSLYFPLESIIIDSN